MQIPKPKIDELVNEMNEKVFSKIREELVKNIERKKTPKEKGVEEQPLEIESREEMLKHIENPEKFHPFYPKTFRVFPGSQG